MINFDTDADIFTNTDEFGVTAIYDGGSISVLFDLVADEHIEGLLPQVIGKKSDFPSINYGDRLVIGSDTYGIVNWYEVESMYVITANEVTE